MRRGNRQRDLYFVNALRRVLGLPPMPGDACRRNHDGYLTVGLSLHEMIYRSQAPSRKQH